MNAMRDEDHRNALYSSQHWPTLIQRIDIWTKPRRTFMLGKPAARLSGLTSCPISGHGTPAVTSGSPDVLVNNLPAARLGDAAAGGQAISGALSSTIFINGKSAAMLGSTLSHGGVVIGGSGDVLIG